VRLPGGTRRQQSHELSPFSASFSRPADFGNLLRERETPHEAESMERRILRAAQLTLGNEVS